MVPVYEGVPILAAWQAQPLAGEAVREAVRADLICRGLVTSSVVGDRPGRLGDNPELLTEDLVRDITLRCCFVTNINRGRQLHEVTERPEERSPTTSLAHLAPLVNYPISGSQFLQVITFMTKMTTKWGSFYFTSHQLKASRVIDKLKFRWFLTFGSALVS